MNSSPWAQILAIIRLEIWKTFFSRRGLWIYLFALAPVLLFAANSIYAPREQARLAGIAGAHPVALTSLLTITQGMSNSVILEKLGEPYHLHVWRHADRGRVFEHAVNRYTDGKSDFTFHFFSGQVRRIERSDPETMPQQLLIFATIFRFYFLRLAVFFGCVGIFTNLFRGEMLDKSLHFYLLTPVRREILLAGKYLAGLLATVIIFTSSVALQWEAMLWQFPHNMAVADYFAGASAAHLLPYLAVTMLACAAYGSVFLCAGLLFRNPIIPAAMVLLWESASLFLPATLQKLGIIYYLQSLCPLAAAPDASMPVPLTLLITATPSAPALAALVCLILFTLAMLVLSAVRSRNLEINYSTD